MNFHFKPLLFLLFVFATACNNGDHSFNFNNEGGTEIIAEPDMPYFLHKQTGFTTNPLFKEALNEMGSTPEKGAEFIKLFLRTAQKIEPGLKLTTLFLGNTKHIYDYKMSDVEVEKKLMDEFSNALARTAVLLERRLEKFGLEKFNVQKLPYGIKIEAGDVKDMLRLRKCIQSYANLGFFKSYDASEVWNQYLAKADGILRELNAARDTTAQADSSGTTENLPGPLIQLIYPNFYRGNHNQYTVAKGALIGWVQAKDSSRFTAYIHNNQVSDVFPHDLHFVFGLKPEEQGLPLYTIKAQGINFPEISEESVEEARADKDKQNGMPFVSMQFNMDATSKWKQLTKDNIDKAIIILMDDRVVTAPVVAGEIPNGNSSISGNITMEEANDLAAVLKVGSLPLHLRIVAEKQIKK